MCFATGIYATFSAQSEIALYFSWVLPSAPSQTGMGPPSAPFSCTAKHLMFRRMKHKEGLDKLTDRGYVGDGGGVRVAENGKSISTNLDDQRERSSPDRRLSSSKNILNVLPNVEVRPMNGRVIGTRSPRIPPMVKAIIGEAAAMGGSNKVVAEEFDVHRNTVSNAKAEHSEAKKELDKEIHDKAIEAIAGMFETCVAPEALAKLETKDATRAMKDLSKVAETFSQKAKNVFNGPTIVVFAPSAHTEDDYDVIDVEAKEVR